MYNVPFCPAWLYSTGWGPRRLWHLRRRIGPCEMPCLSSSSSPHGTPASTRAESVRPPLLAPFLGKLSGRFLPGRGKRPFRWLRWRRRETVSRRWRVRCFLADEARLPCPVWSSWRRVPSELWTYTLDHFFGTFFYNIFMGFMGKNITQIRNDSFIFFPPK